MNRWAWSSSSLETGERVCDTAIGVRLYDGDKKTEFDNGYLTLTNLRLLWRDPKASSSLTLKLSLLVLAEEEQGGFMSSPKIMLHLASLSPDHPSYGTTPTSNLTYVKLSFRQGKMSGFFETLKGALSQKAWEKVDNPTIHVSQNNKNKRARAGILGIERAIEARQKQQDQNIDHAFEDLKHLMSLAKDMVNLSKNITKKVKDQTGALSSDETIQLRSYLLGLGIDDPVTREAMGSTTEYHKQLAKEIAGSLQTPVKEMGGVMLLSEVYCRINRARGLHLLSPDDVFNACCVMTTLKLPLVLHTYKSGVQALQLTSLDEKKLSDDVKKTLDDYRKTGLSISEYAQISKISLLLAQERLHDAEMNAVAVLDESSEGFRFYPNLFLEECSS